jgi:hypothetical protein
VKTVTRTTRLLENVATVKDLAERLENCPGVRKLNQGEENGAWTLALAFADLEESLIAVVDDLLPQLVARPVTEDQMSDILFAIGEELRHIQYHIHDSRYYSYLRDR